MSSVRIIPLFAGVAGMAVCGIASSLISSKMTDEVNAELPEDRRFSPAIWYVDKTQRLLAEHARLFPNSNLRRTWTSLMVLALLFAAMAAIVVFIN